MTHRESEGDVYPDLKQTVSYGGTGGSPFAKYPSPNGIITYVSCKWAFMLTVFSSIGKNKQLVGWEEMEEP